MLIRELNINDQEQLNSLIISVEENLIDDTFWLPINCESKKHFFNKSWTCFYGAFDNEKLIGAVGLFFNINEFGESQKVLNMENKKIAELGRAMIDPNYRNQGIMNLLAKVIINQASKSNLDAIIATVHPQNIPSQSFLKKLNFNKRGFVLKDNKYPRDILVKEF